jgi:predicted transcriptional regulator of viral defense system
LKTAYREFEERVGQTAEPRGAKTELVGQAIEKAKGPFSVGDLQRECPGVGPDLIRAMLKRLRAEGRVECLGRGQHARWQKTPRRK